MAAGSNSSQRQHNSLANRASRAAGRDQEREKGPVAGAFGKDDHPNRTNQMSGQGAGGGGGSYSKSDFNTVGRCRRAARKRKG
jgi:hypothetical protein